MSVMSLVDACGWDLRQDAATTSGRARLGSRREALMLNVIPVMRVY